MKARHEGVRAERLFCCFVDFEKNPGRPSAGICLAKRTGRGYIALATRVLLTDRQAKSYVAEGVRISLHGEYADIGVAKQISPTMEIRANILCSANQRTVTEKGEHLRKAVGKIEPNVASVTPPDDRRCRVLARWRTDD